MTYTDRKERQTIGVLSIPVEVLFRKKLCNRRANIRFVVICSSHGSNAVGVLNILQIFLAYMRIISYLCSRIYV